MTTTPCPECGGQNCEENFHQMLYWENENPANGEVHHLTVLSYYLQHPRLYSPEGLEGAKSLLLDFLERGLSPQQVRQQNRDKVASDKRVTKITARPGQTGAYDHPVRWTMTAGDISAAGEPQYIPSVRAWAQSILASLKESDNI